MWEDIPGLDGYFLISSFGRIKRQLHEVKYRNGALYIKPEKIIKPQIIRQPNRFKKDYTYFLTGRVTLSGRRYNITIARMVYHCFIEPFDLEDQDIVIICRNGDNFHIHPSNLEMATKSQKQQRMVARKRFKSPFLDMTEQDRIEQRKAILKTVSKQVTQYSMTGRKIKTFPSAAEAERATGVFATSIWKVASGGDISAGGFIWRWNKDPRMDVKALRQKKRNAYIKKYGQKVTQYDLTGNRIAHYPCVRDAAEATGVQVNSINKILKGEYKSSKGFFWKKGYGRQRIDLSTYKWGKQSMAATQSKPVKQYSLDGKYIQIFSSIKVAAQRVGLHPSSVIGALQGRQRTCGGFKWKYV